MPSVLLDSLRGTVRPQGSIEQADSIVALEFSRRKPGLGVGRPNLETAILITDPRLAGLPLYTGQTVTEALVTLDADIRPADVFIGDSAEGISENTGTYGELEQLLYMLRAANLHNPIVFHTAWNITKASQQLTKLSAEIWDVNPIVPANQPRSFDAESMQFWTQSARNWRLMTAPRLAALTRNGH